MKVSDALARLQRIASAAANDSANPASQRDLVIVLNRPGWEGSTPICGIRDIGAGFDWEPHRVFLWPTQPLSSTPTNPVKVRIDRDRRAESSRVETEIARLRAQVIALTDENTLLRLQVRAPARR